MAVKYEDSRGVVRVKGGRDLKLSQSYPREFLDQNMYKCLNFVGEAGFVLANSIRFPFSPTA